MKPTSFYPPQRKLMGPGPSDTCSRVLMAAARPTLGHLDPLFIDMMDELKRMLQHGLGTENAFTLPLSSPASAAMEAAIVNILQPGEKMIVCRNGVFGMRMSDIVKRLGGVLVTVDDAWGETVDVQKVAEAVRANPDAVAVAFVYAETSTGARADAPAIAKLARDAGMLCIADCVTAFGGIELKTDEWGLDVVYAGSQKCLSAPPGLAPFTMSAKALEKVGKRDTPVQSWFLDVNLLGGYWQGQDKKRAYHHTAPVNSLYALHEALVILLEEGLDNAIRRHAKMHAALLAGLGALGLQMTVAEQWRLPQLNSVGIPAGVDDGAVRRVLLEDYNLEIGAGLGELAGKVWRIGLMGYGARAENVLYCIHALENVLSSMGAVAELGKAVPAAQKVLAAS